MKTTIFFRNAAATLVLALMAGFAFSQEDGDETSSWITENNTYTKAGYWIDAVVVNGNVENAEKERFSALGYYIEPVTVSPLTSSSAGMQPGSTRFDSRKEMLNQSFVSGPSETLEVSLMSHTSNR